MNPRFVLLFALAIGWAGAASAAGKDTKKSGASIQLVVSLSKPAAARLAKAHEAIGVSASFFGTPENEAARRAAAGDGQIALGVVDKRLAKAGRVRIAPPAFDRAKLALIELPGPRVNINVFSARKALPDNVLDCDFFEDSLAVALRKPVALHCKLIGETAPAKAGK